MPSLFSPVQNKHHRKQFLVLAVLLSIVLMLPLAYYFIWQNPDWHSALLTAAATLSALVLLLLIGSKARHKWPRTTALLFTVIFSVALLVRIFYALLLDLTGQGFTSEVFIHTEWDAAKIGMQEYALPLSLGLLVLLGLIIWLYRHPFWHRHAPGQNGAHSHGLSAWLLPLLIALPALALLQFGQALPSVQLYKAYSRFTGADTGQLFFDAKSEDEAIQKALRWLEPIRGKRPLPTPKDRLQASASPDSPNLIFIYLESFSDMLTENPDYPGLTPNIDALKKRFTALGKNHSSAYVTIEGIANSQCGTLMNMQFSNNSLTTPNGRLPGMACLSDILHAAGYHQTFLGGAKSEFAGKGDFFRDHGYDRVWGWNHWQELGFNNEGLWGLPDTRLFEQALKTIADYRHKKQRYNVTMLTLGTHLPGFSYKGCPLYPANPEEKYLNAVHCTDFLLGQFVRQLEERGLLEDTVLYVQGDHGVFKAPEMKRLFGKKKIEDNRVLTILSTPSKAPAVDSGEKESSTYDTVNSLVELLKIKHNTDFVLARSILDTSTEPRYFITRYSDYYRGTRVTNPKTSECPADQQKPTLPLSKCEKDITMKAIYTLNNLYTKKVQLQPLCERGLSIAKSAKGRLIQVKLAGKDISSDFREKGFPVSTAKPGLSLLLLDNEGQVLGRVHLSLTDKDDIKRIDHYLATAPTGSTLVLARNVRKDEVPAEIFSLWPEPVKKYMLFIGERTTAEANAISSRHVESKNWRVMAAETAPEFGVRIYPKSCQKPLETGIPMTNLPNPRFCRIKKWGPQKTLLGKGLNVIQDGRSAFWFKTDCAPDYPEIRVDGKVIATTKNLPTITAALDASELVQQAGRHRVELVDSATGESQLVGYFTVIDPAQPDRSKPGRQKAATAPTPETTAESRFCAIRKWGPKKLIAGKPFNTQPDGSSAFWIVTDCAPENAVAYLDGKPLKTLGGPPQLAAVIAPGEEIQKPGRHPLTLTDPATGQRIEVGVVKVKPSSESNQN